MKGSCVTLEFRPIERWATTDDFSIEAEFQEEIVENRFIVYSVKWFILTCLSHLLFPGFSLFWASQHLFGVWLGVKRLQIHTWTNTELYLTEYWAKTRSAKYSTMKFAEWSEHLISTRTIVHVSVKSLAGFSRNCSCIKEPLVNCVWKRTFEYLIEGLCVGLLFCQLHAKHLLHSLKHVLFLKGCEIKWVNRLFGGRKVA